MVVLNSEQCLGVTGFHGPVEGQVAFVRQVLGHPNLLDKAVLRSHVKKPVHRGPVRVKGDVKVEVIKADKRYKSLSRKFDVRLSSHQRVVQIHELDLEQNPKLGQFELMVPEW